MRSFAAWRLWPIAVATSCTNLPPAVRTADSATLPVPALVAPDAGPTKSALQRNEGRAVVFIAGRPSGIDEDQYRFVPLICVDHGKMGHGERCAAGLAKSLE